MMTYIHPVLPRDDFLSYTGIMDMETGKFELAQGSTEGWDEIGTDVDVFLAKVRNSHEWRRRLGIPSRVYHAYGFPYRGYDLEHVRSIIEWVRGHDLELRTWVNEQSALLLLVVADPDMGENSGWALYQYIKKHAPSYRSYGLASWFEFCQFGTPVAADWFLLSRGDRLFVSSPDGRKVLMFG